MGPKISEKLEHGPQKILKESKTSISVKFNAEIRFEIYFLKYEKCTSKVKNCPKNCFF